MTCELVKKGFNAIGFKNSCCFKDYPLEIPKTFSKLMEIAHEIPHEEGVTVAFYGPGEPPAPDVVGTYYATVLVDDTSPLPEGMSSVMIPARKFMRMTHKGEIHKIRETYDELDAWIAEQGYEHEYDWIVEVYGEKFSPTCPDSELDIYMPIK
ncbi:GyrI-like domain-containing protein [Bacillus shivajii]|uniref:GyrI-like domain-containing protein n=1 Tax=Bacillus shivajii TaxID=1983719 RepID=UPI001CF9B46B|nr:GyrI-like domain-containing protein [Bacillus shivajii]UCZ53518.1 GyrI-like domain-containing protein [Bacillus shivajii]